jgi:hypothetical protein
MFYRANASSCFIKKLIKNESNVLQGKCLLLFHKKLIKNDSNVLQGRDRVSKAQKRRDRKEQKERDRQLDIDRQDELNKLGLRHLEAQKLKELLTK